METPHQLAARFSEVFLNGKWIANTNYKENLATVSWQQAIYKIESLNTIGILTFHINYYLKGVLKVLEGGTLDIKDKYSFDAPPITSYTDWDNLYTDLITNAEKFASHINHLSPEQLEAPFVDPKYGSYRRNIEAMIEHAYYHLGQISLIKKMILTKQTN
ncbi:DinB family protein [Aquimarina rhabdastrellae]